MGSKSCTTATSCHAGELGELAGDRGGSERGFLFRVQALERIALSVTTQVVCLRGWSCVASWALRTVALAAGLELAVLPALRSAPPAVLRCSMLMANSQLVSSRDRLVCL